MRLVRVWIGLVLVLFGVLGALDALEIVDAGSVLGRWWPLAVIGIGIAAMVSQRRVSTGPLVVAGIGVVLLADRLALADGNLIWPALFILAGALVLAGLGRRHYDHKGRSVGQPVAFFGGVKVTDHSEHLRHADVSAIFGGATLDLRDAHIDREATVDALALFGGVDVLVPKGWRVSVGGLPIFGGYEDKTVGNGSLAEDAPLLQVNATAIFGGIDVANEPH